LLHPSAEKPTIPRKDSAPMSFRPFMR
jgi:hypothetical protein